MSRLRLILQQFTFLWSATLGDGGVDTVYEDESLVVTDKSVQRAGDDGMNSCVANHSSEEKMMEQQVQRRLVEMWEDTCSGSRHSENFSSNDSV